MNNEIQKRNAGALATQARLPELVAQLVSLKELTAPLIRGNLTSFGKHSSYLTTDAKAFFEIADKYMIEVYPRAAAIVEQFCVSAPAELIAIQIARMVKLRPGAHAADDDYAGLLLEEIQMVQPPFSVSAIILGFQELRRAPGDFLPGSGTVIDALFSAEENFRRQEERLWRLKTWHEGMDAQKNHRECASWRERSQEWIRRRSFPYRTVLRSGGFRQPHEPPPGHPYEGQSMVMDEFTGGVRKHHGLWDWQWYDAVMQWVLDGTWDVELGPAPNEFFCSLPNEVREFLGLPVVVARPARPRGSVVIPQDTDKRSGLGSGAEPPSGGSTTGNRGGAPEPQDIEQITLGMFKAFKEREAVPRQTSPNLNPTPNPTADTERMPREPIVDPAALRAFGEQMERIKDANMRAPECVKPWTRQRRASDTARKTKDDSNGDDF